MVGNIFVVDTHRQAGLAGPDGLQEKMPIQTAPSRPKDLSLFLLAKHRRQAHDVQYANVCPHSLVNCEYICKLVGYPEGTLFPKTWLQDRIGIFRVH